MYVNIIHISSHNIHRQACALEHGYVVGGAVSVVAEDAAIVPLGLRRAQPGQIVLGHHLEVHVVRQLNHVGGGHRPAQPGDKRERTCGLGVMLNRLAPWLLAPAPHTVDRFYSSQSIALKVHIPHLPLPSSFHSFFRWLDFSTPDLFCKYIDTPVVFCNDVGALSGGHLGRSHGDAARGPEGHELNCGKSRHSLRVVGVGEWGC